MFRSKCIVFYLLATVVLTSIYSHSRFWKEHVNVLSWDVYGYYLYLPAVFIYDDIDSFEFTASHLSDYKVAHGQVYQVAEKDGETLPIYTIGVALLFLPFFIIGHLISLVSPNYLSDGLSAPYQWSIIFGAWIYCFLGMYYLRRTLQLLKIRDAAISLTLTAVVLGTNYFHYVTFQSGMPHSWLFTLYTMFMFYTMKWHEKPKIRWSVYLGVLSALITLSRPTEGILVLLFLFYGVTSFKGINTKVQSYLKNLLPLSVLLLVGVAVVGIQIVFWKLAGNTYYHNAYMDAGHVFHFESPHIVEGLFSYRKGWLVYTPIMFFALLGLLVNHKYAKWRWAIFSFFVVNTYIVLSWHMWWYANSFGMRSLIQSYAVLAIPMAAGFDKIWEKSWLRNSCIVVVMSLVGLNQFQDWQIKKKILPGDKINKTFYWLSFGKTDLDKSLRKYLTTNYKRPSSMEITSQLCDLPQVSITSPDSRFGESCSFIIASEYKFAKINGQVVNVAADFLMEDDQFGQYDGAKFVFSVKRSGETIQWVGVEIQKILEVGQWQRIDYDVRVTDDLQVGDEIFVLLWNTSPDTIEIKNLQVNCFGVEQ